MKTTDISNINTIGGLQFGLLTSSTFILYTLFCGFDYSFQSAKFVGLRFNNPLYFLSVLFCTFIAGYILGLPIRRITNFANLWNRLKWLRALMFSLGIAFMVWSIFRIERINYRLDGMYLFTFGPSQFLQITGWALISFTSMHFFPLKKLSDKS